MESRANFKGNPSSSRDPFPRNGFNLLLNEVDDDDLDQFQETRNVEESNTSELDTSNKDSSNQECQRYQLLLNLFPETPNDLLPNESYEVGSTSNNRDNNNKKKQVRRDCIGIATATGSKDCDPIIKGRWTHEEDSKLAELVDKYGKKRWASIAKTLGGRLGKQCRERWENHLKDNLKREVWTEEEILEIIQGHKELGSRWAELARRFPRRSQNSIKNLWNGTKRRLQNALRKALRNGGPCRELTPLESYINSLITNEPIIMRSGTEVDNSNNGPAEIDNDQVNCSTNEPAVNGEVDSQLMMMMIDLNSEEPPERSSHQIRIRSSNTEPKNSGGDPVPVPVPVSADDKLSGSKLNEDKAGPDQPGMSEEIYGQKETDFMELLINSY